MPTKAAIEEPAIDMGMILKRLRELEKQLGREQPMPQAPNELWPGGPSLDLGDMQLARLIRARMKGDSVYGSLQPPIS